MAKTSFTMNPTKIMAIGLGGGGCNAINRMVRADIKGVDFVGMNTDAQALALIEAPIRIQLGERITRGLGSGGDNTRGREAAEESRDELRELITGADMVFITAGMGGGTGTGSAPVVAEIAKRSGALTIAIVTTPFAFEGTHRRQVAEEGISNLLEVVDTLIMIPNDRLFDLCDQKTSVDSAFQMADDVLKHGVQAISEVITAPGLVNLDFADVRAVMKDAGPAWMSIGRGSGQNRAVDVAKEALSSPLLDVSVEGARGVLFNVVGGTNLTLFEVNEAAKVIKKAVDPEANIIFGVAHDPAMDKEIRITLIATGFAAQRGIAGVGQDEELSNFLTGLKRSENEMDVPSFLRYPTGRRRLTVAPSLKPEKETSVKADKTAANTPAH
ncbi:MAG: cell division protein FtsZ [Chloroflexi bacterium]|nr:cell division protein FtsZ [Chloroflexota bacterium]